MSKGTTGDGMHIAILGAPGCVGQSLIKKFLENPEYTIIASYRTEHEIPKNVRDDRLVWKQVNLFDPAIPFSAEESEDLLIDPHRGNQADLLGHSPCF